MRFILIIVLLLVFTLGYSQSLPIDFENGITTADFVDFNGGTATVMANPQSNGINTSATVAQIVRDGGDVWAGSKIELASNLDFTSFGIISMKVYTSAPVGTTVKFKLEGNGETEQDVLTTVQNEWETLTWDFTGLPMNYNSLVFMFDFGNIGDGSATSTFLFDDVEQLFGGTQIDWPVDFEGSSVNYTTTDFGGNISSLVEDPTNTSNHVIKAIKTGDAATWAGTTIGRPSGFATDIPLTLTDSKMTVRVWSPAAGTPIRLKVEDSNDPTHTCETEVNTTVAAAWETIIFDFNNQAPGTELLSVGLSMGWTYNMASIFFNFGTEGVDAGEQTYYFDDVQFGIVNSTQSILSSSQITAFPNPSSGNWTIATKDAQINSISLFKLTGEKILDVFPESKTTVIIGSHLAHGIYVAKVQTEKGIKAMRLIKID